MSSIKFVETVRSGINYFDVFEVIVTKGKETNSAFIRIDKDPAGGYVSAPRIVEQKEVTMKVWS